MKLFNKSYSVRVMKAFSFILLVSFAGSEIAQAASLSGVSSLPAASKISSPLLDVSSFQVPGAYSQYKESHQAPLQNGSPAPLIILIQDAHANLSSQENLAKTLDDLMERYQFSDVLVEGGSGDVSLSPLRELMDAASMKRVAGRYLRDAEISGAEYLNLTSSRPMNLKGIEDLDLYVQGLKAYAQLADQREKILSYLDKSRIAVENLKKRHYPYALLSYEKSANRAVSPEKLVEVAQKQGISFSEFAELTKLSFLLIEEKQIDFSLAQLELGSIVEKIGAKDAGSLVRELSLEPKQKGAGQYAYFRKIIEAAKAHNVDLSSMSQFQNYTAYLEKFSKLDMAVLLEEAEKFEQIVYSRLLDHETAHTLRAVDRYLELLETAYRIQMTSSEFALFLENTPDFPTISWQAFLNRNLLEEGFNESLVPLEKYLEEGRVALEAFYRAVDARDLAFIKNIENWKKENQANTQSKICALIAGGYHTSHLAKLLKEKGYSYVVITPIVTSATNQAKYEKVLLAPLKSETKIVQTVNGKAHIAGVDGQATYAAFAGQVPVAIVRESGRTRLSPRVEGFVGQTTRARRNFQGALLKNTGVSSATTLAPARLAEVRFGFENAEKQTTHSFASFNIGKLLNRQLSILPDAAVDAVREYLQRAYDKKWIKGFKVVDLTASQINIHISHNHGENNADVHRIMLEAIRAGLETKSMKGRLNINPSAISALELTKALQVSFADHRFLERPGVSESVEVAMGVNVDISAFNNTAYDLFGSLDFNPAPTLSGDKIRGVRFYFQKRADILRGITKISVLEVSKKEEGGYDINQLDKIKIMLSQNENIVTAVYPVRGAAFKDPSEPLMTVTFQPVFGSDGEPALNPIAIFRGQSGGPPVGAIGHTVANTRYVLGGPKADRYVAVRPYTLKQARKPIREKGIGGFVMYGYEQAGNGYMPRNGYISDYFGLSVTFLYAYIQKARRFAKVMLAHEGFQPFLHPRAAAKYAEPVRHELNDRFVDVVKDFETDPFYTDVDRRVAAGELVKFTSGKVDFGATNGHTKAPAIYTALQRAYLEVMKERGLITDYFTLGQDTDDKMKRVSLEANYGTGDDTHVTVIGGEAEDVQLIIKRALGAGPVFHMLAFKDTDQKEKPGVGTYGLLQDLQGSDAEAVKKNPFGWLGLGDKAVAERFFELANQLADERDIKAGVIESLYNQWKTWNLTQDQEEQELVRGSGNTSAQGIGVAYQYMDAKRDKGYAELNADKMGPQSKNVLWAHVIQQDVPANGRTVEIWDVKAFDEKGNIASKDLPRSWSDLSYLVLSALKAKEQRITPADAEWLEKTAYAGGTLSDAAKYDRLNTILKHIGYVPSKRIFMDVETELEQIKTILGDSDRFNVKALWDKKQSGWDPSRAEDYLDRPVAMSTVSRLGLLAGGEYVGKDDDKIMGTPDVMQHFFDYLEKTPWMLQGDMNGSHQLQALLLPLDEAVATINSAPIAVALINHFDENGRPTGVTDVFKSKAFQKRSKQAAVFNLDFILAQRATNPHLAHREQVEGAYAIEAISRALDSPDSPYWLDKLQAQHPGEYPRPVSADASMLYTAVGGNRVASYLELSAARLAVNTVQLTQDRLNTISLDFTDNTSDAVINRAIENGATEVTTNPFSIATSLVKGNDPALSALIAAAPPTLRGRELLKWVYWNRGKQIAKNPQLVKFFKESKGDHGWVTVEVDPTFSYLWEVQTTDGIIVTPVLDEKGIFIRKELQGVLGEQVESLQALERMLSDGSLRVQVHNALVKAILLEVKEIATYAPNIAVTVGNTRGLKQYLGEDLALSVGLTVLEEATALGISTNFTRIFGRVDAQANQAAWRQGYLRAQNVGLVSADNPVRGHNSVFVSPVEPYTLANIRDKGDLDYAQGMVGLVTAVETYLRGYSENLTNDSTINRDQNLIIASLENEGDGPPDFNMSALIGGGERAVLTITPDIIDSFNQNDPNSITPTLGEARTIYQSTRSLEAAIVPLITPFFKMADRLQPLFNTGYMVDLKEGRINAEMAAVRAYREYNRFRTLSSSKTMLDTLSVEGDVKFAGLFLLAISKVDQAGAAARLASNTNQLSDAGPNADLASTITVNLANQSSSLAAANVTAAPAAAGLVSTGIDGLAPNGRNLVSSTSTVETSASIIHFASGEVRIPPSQLTAEQAESIQFTQRDSAALAQLAETPTTLSTSFAFSLESVNGLAVTATPTSAVTVVITTNQGSARTEFRSTSQDRSAAQGQASSLRNVSSAVSNESRYIEQARDVYHSEVQAAGGIKKIEARMIDISLSRYATGSPALQKERIFNLLEALLQVANAEGDSLFMHRFVDVESVNANVLNDSAIQVLVDILVSKNVLAPDPLSGTMSPYKDAVTGLAVKEFTMASSVNLAEVTTGYLPFAPYSADGGGYARELAWLYLIRTASIQDANDPSQAFMELYLSYLPLAQRNDTNRTARIKAFLRGDVSTLAQETALVWAVPLVQMTLDEAARLARMMRSLTISA